MTSNEHLGHRDLHSVPPMDHLCWRDIVTREVRMSEPGNAKSHAREIIDRLPESASWDDVMYELYVRESIDAGLADVAEGRTIPHEQVRARLSELVRRAS